MFNQQIFWFQDGAKLSLPKSLWSNLDRMTGELINLVGHPDFNHQLVDPCSSFQRLINQLPPKEFSCIIDLTGFLGDWLKDVFPSTKLVENFHLSRLRLVSSPRLDGVGFLSSLGINAINQLKREIDLSRPLVIDDISWSGRTILETQKLFGLTADSTTVGLLVGNRGEFGLGKPGGVSLLADQGFEVVSGSSVFTPNDDGFHLADFFDHPEIKAIFDTVILIQEMREQQQDGLIKEIFRQKVKELFPDALDHREILELQRQGKLINKGGLAKDGFFTVNPLNWLMPSFSKRVRSEDLRINYDGLLNILRELRELNFKSGIEFEVRRAGVERL